MTTNQLLKIKEAAAYLGIAPKTLARWRWQGKAPRAHKLGGAVRFAVADLDAFIANCAQ